MSSTKNTFIIGDIHGCFDELQDLLQAANVSLVQHQVILVGDLINKGPASLKVLKWARDHQIPSVLGNHELRFLKSLNRETPMPPRLKELKNEMGKTLNHWIQWLQTWPAYIETPNYIVVHGGLEPNRSLNETDPLVLVNIRTWEGSTQQMYRPGAPPWYSFYKGKKPVFYGHWATQGIHIESNTYCLDSGCVYGRSLTGIWAETKEIVQVPARKIYCPVK